MAATYEQLIGVGMSEAQARLLAVKLDGHGGRRDLSSNPMVVTLVGCAAAAVFTALIGILAWMAVSIVDLRTEFTREIALLQQGQAAILERLSE